MLLQLAVGVAIAPRNTLSEQFWRKVEERTRLFSLFQRDLIRQHAYGEMRELSSARQGMVCLGAKPP